MNLLFGTDECYKLYLSDNYDDRNRDFNVEKFIFPGGELHVKITSNREGDKFPDDLHNLPIRIYHTIKRFEDVGTLYMTVDALRDLNCWKLSLVLPYFPGARQDRRADGVCEPMSVKVYADLINALKLDEVIIFDAHSDVTPALINNCVSLTNEKFYYEACPTNVHFLSVSPDAGAAKKTEKVCAYLKSKGTDVEYEGLPDIIYCRKQRNMKTGELSGFTIDNPIDLKGIDCVVVDDICDGGRTFIEVAKILKANNAGKLHLVVSHGIFSGGFRTLLKHFDTITTTNSWTNEDIVYNPAFFGDVPPTESRVKIINFVRLYDL